MSTAKWANLGKALAAPGLRVEAPVYTPRITGNTIWPRNKTQAPVLGSFVINKIKSPSRKLRKSRKTRKTRKTRKSRR